MDDINLPTINLEVPPNLETISIPLPTGKIPYYEPMVVPPSDLEAPEGVKAETKETTEQPEPPSIKLPVFNFDVPLPTTEVVMAATYAAVSAVAVTTFAQPLFNTIKKNIQKFLQKKIDTWKKKRQKKKVS